MVGGPIKIVVVVPPVGLDALGFEELHPPKIAAIAVTAAVIIHPRGLALI